ncbi:ABC transporter substrate-binding protein [Corynebacterium aurimucosum]
MTSRRSFLGMLVALAVSGIVAPTVAGCTAEPGGVDTPDMNLITTDISEPQRTLIPADSNDVPGQTIINLVYSGLMYLDETGGAHYDLAESITQVDDRTYDVVIRDDAVFSDGSTVEAEDFVDTWNTAVRQSLLSAHHFEPILGFHEGRKTMRGLTVTGRKTFRIELSRPTAGFLERLGYSVFSLCVPKTRIG